MSNIIKKDTTDVLCQYVVLNILNNKLFGIGVTDENTKNKIQREIRSDYKGKM